MNERILAATIRRRLLTGAKPDSIFYRIVSQMDDAELVERDKDAHEERVQWARQKAQLAEA